MDIASSTMQMNLQSVQQSLSVSMLRKAMNADASAVEQLLQTMPPVVAAPPSEHLLDVRA